MHQAFQQVVDRHEALRISIGSDGDVQYVHQRLALPLLIIDFSLIKPSECTSKLEQWLYTEHQRGFDLTHGYLLRVHILKIAAYSHILVLSTHHIVIDGWSTN